MNLDEIGIRDGITETIVTTFDLKNKLNAAPIGIIRKNNKISIKLFKNSKTYENIFKVKVFVANITYDSIAFVNATFNNMNTDDFEFISFEGMQYPIIKNSIGFVIFRCNSIEIKNDILFADLKPIFLKINKKKLYAPNRGFNAIIEALVHATRFKIFKIKKYKELVQYYSNLAIKCGGTREKDAASMIDEFLSLKNLNK